MITIRVIGWCTSVPINERYLIQSLMTKSPVTSYKDFEVPVDNVGSCLIKLVELGFKFNVWGGN